MTFDLKQYLTQKKEIIDVALEKHWINTQHIRPQELCAAMSYSLMAPGKRIRPVLVFASAECLGLSDHDVLPLAAALEMIHAFSLIHDDLPAMDNDDLRRGRPTNHKVYGEALAILAGDALLSHAFVVLSDLDAEKFSPQNIIDVIHQYAKATGTTGMISGQVWDMQSENKNISLNELKNLHRHKTGALITLAVTSPALLKGVAPDMMDALICYSEAIGLGFQIIDDILDIEGDASLGKPIGSDEAKNKSTYPKLLGLDGAKKETQNQLTLALDALNIFGPEADPLRAIAKFIVERKY